MRLKKIELSGFKSFAKTTVLEFPSRVTAIVGPNGSGKSNIKEAMQWVMGEQSMKSLRGKKGEDLIWNGSPASRTGGPQVPRMGKASVSLNFDNKDGKIPIDFEEVTITRKIFRDGINEYYLNNSQVRLRDIVELAARMGLGESKHNIIGQGEVDRILLASPREKRELLEDALGLRVYQLKKNETERKLDATSNNMGRVESLIREITPHLRFLKQQAEKHKTRETLEKDLLEFQQIFLSKEQAEIRREKFNIEEKKNPLVKKIEEIRKEIKKLLEQISAAEKKITAGNQATQEEKKLMGLEAKRRELERELGRLEGKLEIEKEKISQPRLRVVDTHYIQQEIKEFIAITKAIINEEEKIEAIKTHLEHMIRDFEELLGKIQKGTIEEKRKEEESAIVKELQKTIKSLQEELARTAHEAEKLEGVRREEEQSSRELQVQIRELDMQLRKEQDRERDLALQLERFKFAEERLYMREKAFQHELHLAKFNLANLLEQMPEAYQNMSGEDLKKKIERLHIRLEEVGGIDESVVKEFQELEVRHTFLSKELEDLKSAQISLKELLRELDQHIKNNFKEGFAKIKEEFNKLFRIIFGGGKATIHLLKPIVKKLEEGEMPPAPDEIEEGIEIDVDLPRKRIKGLAMLSGGERALTSIALLFAIISINPPPFLILDETDAALDEANTQRYVSTLKELAQCTQLIIVTHNRETMKSAGILYGVTMGEDGVSKLLSLKLEEAEAYTNR